MSPNLTAALLAERAKRVTAVDIPEINATVHVRKPSYSEGINYARKNKDLPKAGDGGEGGDNQDVQIALMEDMLILLVVDPETMEPLFSADHRPSDIFPVEEFMAFMLTCLNATGILNTTPVTTAATTVEVSDTREGEEGAGPLEDGTTNDLSLVETTGTTAEETTEKETLEAAVPASTLPNATGSSTALPLN